MDCIHSSSSFQVHQSLYQSFGDCTKSTNYNWYKRHFHVPQFFRFPSKGRAIYPSFYFLSILLCGQSGQQSPQFYYTPCKFFMTALADSFSLEFERQQFSRTVLSILADLNNAIVWLVSTYLLISKFSSLCINPLGIVSNAPLIIGITVTFMFQSFFSSLARSWYSSLLSLSFNFTLWSA